MDDTPDDRFDGSSDRSPNAAPPVLGEHPVRTALLQLLRQVESLTANEAGRRLGRSSGLCSFHLRQLGRAGLVEEVPQAGGRARPWRLPGRGEGDRGRGGGASGPTAGGSGSTGQGAQDFSCFSRGLEDESYRRWLAERGTAPEQWRRDDAFSSVLYLTPDEIGALADQVRRLLAPYQAREWLPATRPAQAAPVAVVSRIFPILPAAADEAVGRSAGVLGGTGADGGPRDQRRSG